MAGSLYQPSIRFRPLHGNWECRSRWKLDRDHFAIGGSPRLAYRRWLESHPDLVTRYVPESEASYACWQSYFLLGSKFGLPENFSIKASRRADAIKGVVDHIMAKGKKRPMASDTITVDVIGLVPRYSANKIICRYEGKLFACSKWRFRGTGGQWASVRVKRLYGEVVLPNQVKIGK